MERVESSCQPRRLASIGSCGLGVATTTTITTTKRASRRGRRLVARLAGFALVVLALASTEARPARAGDRPAAVDVVFALDNSGSMRGVDPDALARRAVLAFADQLAMRARKSGFEARLAVIVFDDAVELALPLTAITPGTSAALLAPALERLDYSGQRTRSADAIERALYALREAPSDHRRAIVLLTDGRLDTGDPARDREATAWLRGELAAESRERGVQIFGLAFTDRADYQLLQSLARQTGADYYRAATAAELAPIGSKILARLDASVGLDDRPAPEPAPPAVGAAPVSDALLPSGIDASPSRLGWLPIAALLVVAGGLLGLRSRLRASALPLPLEDAGLSRAIGPTAQLLDVGGVLGETGRAYDLARGRTRIGRDAHNDLVIADATISSEHAVIELRDGRYWLEDLRSTNGTRHGDVRLAGGLPVLLKGGDHVRFADVDLMFVLPGYVPGGGTVVLPATNTPPTRAAAAGSAAAVATTPAAPVVEPSPARRPTAGARDDAPRAAVTPLFESTPSERFRRCLDAHLTRVAELSPAFRDFVDATFDDELRAAIAVALAEEVDRAERADGLALRSYTRERIRFVLCGASGDLAAAAQAYQAGHGGFTRFLTEEIESERYRADRCELLAVLTAGRVTGMPWVSLTLVANGRRGSAIDLLSYELLSKKEREAIEPPSERSISQSGLGA